MRSKRITDKIDHGDMSEKPGWVRLSLHPTMTNDELRYILHAIEHVIKNAAKLGEDYSYCTETNAFHHQNASAYERVRYEDWFDLSGG
jgi:hypothetical protein